jgi:hypothetical protein
MKRTPVQNGKSGGKGFEKPGSLTTENRHLASKCRDEVYPSFHSLPKFERDLVHNCDLIGTDSGSSGNDLSDLTNATCGDIGVVAAKSMVTRTEPPYKEQLRSDGTITENE